MTRILITTLALHTLTGCGDDGSTPELTLSLDTAGLEQDERIDDADIVFGAGQCGPSILPRVPAVV